MSKSGYNDESTESELLACISDNPDLKCPSVSAGLGSSFVGDDVNREECYIDFTGSSQSNSVSPDLVELLEDHNTGSHQRGSKSAGCDNENSSYSDTSDSDSKDAYNERGFPQSTSSLSDVVDECFTQSSISDISSDRLKVSMSNFGGVIFEQSNMSDNDDEFLERFSKASLSIGESVEVSENIDKPGIAKTTFNAVCYDDLYFDKSKEVNISSVASADFSPTKLMECSSSSPGTKMPKRRRNRKKKPANLDKSTETSAASLTLANPCHEGNHSEVRVRSSQHTGSQDSEKRTTKNLKKQISHSAKTSATKGHTQKARSPSQGQKNGGLVLYDPARDCPKNCPIDPKAHQSGASADIFHYPYLYTENVPGKEKKKRRPKHRHKSNSSDTDIKKYEQSKNNGRQYPGAEGQTRSWQGKHRSVSESDAHIRLLQESEAAVQILEAEHERKPKSRTRRKKTTCQVDKLKFGDISHPDSFVECDDHAFLLNKLAGDITGMKLECQSKLEKNLLDLERQFPFKKKIPSKKPNYVDLDKYESNKVLTENLQKSIEENELRRESFFAFCYELEEDIKEHIHSTNSSIALEAYKVLEKRFQRECFKYDKALPIYARRSEILRVIERHQTCVLIGETGSGKSTQLVQYLYEAGYAVHGLIACTQPRKLAARSLALHVSEEAGEKPGETYTYFGTDSRWKGMPKVVFMTDHTLLNECIADRRLSKYTVIVIDEAHERSIHTDILIALIKRCLPERQDLRVIVTSATINPKSFSDYFGGPGECPVIRVPGRVFPVEKFWENSKVALLDRNYVNETVMKAHDIHIKNKGSEGDILVFLTSPVEIEKACKLAKETMKNEVVVLPLHGKLQPEEQQKVFEETSGKRKIVFSTNVAETSVTIPGIKYVIDTGLSKEMGYDPQRNMNSLEIRPISQSSADQRKGRAGRTGPGECHRLFSEPEYKSMRNESTPEILRITLSFAVIKLYEFGIDDIHSFEFVDAPDKKALDDAVENLKFHGAIAEGKLTQLGKKMAFLPVEPNLSKVLLDSIDQGIGSAGTAAAAISSLAGQVFFRPSQDELKEESDQMRLPFCQDSGDQMTNLHTYCEWTKQPKSNRSSWCKDHYVNGKSMRMVQELVNELVTILKQKCHINVPPTLNLLDNADEILPKLFFNVFLKNLSVHLGHDKIGYWCENLPTQQLVLHYGSSLQYLGSRPQCVIFEKTQRTSQNFMLQVLPVKEEWIREALEMKKLQYHPLQAPLYSFYHVSGLLTSNLGPKVISRLRNKYRSDRRIPVWEFRDLEVQPLFEYSNECGELKITAQETYHDKIKRSVMEFVEEVKHSLKKEEHEDGIVGGNNDVRIIMGEGGVIKSVLMPDQFQGIKIHGVHQRLIDTAVEEIQAYGKCNVEYGKHHTDGTVPIFVKFQKPEDACRALRHTFQGFDDPSVVIHRLQPKNRNTFQLRIAWTRRERRPYAFINLSEEEYEYIILLNINIKFPNTDILSGLRFELTERKSIKIDGVQFHMDAEYIKARLLHRIPALSNLKSLEIRFIYHEKFDETREMYLKQKNELNDKLLEIVQREKYYMDFPFPTKCTAPYYVAYIHFDDSQDCENVKTELFGLRYKAEMSLVFSLRYTPRIFSVIQPSVKVISDSFPGLITCDRRDKYGNVFVRISATDITSFVDCKDTFEKSVEPLEIKFGNKQGKYSTTPTFIKHVREIEHDTETVIKWQSLNVTNDTIAIFGTEENKQVSKQKILKHLSDNLPSDISFFEINLKNYKPGTLKELVLNYGRAAERLAENFDGIKAIKLDFRYHILQVFSTSESYNLVLKNLEQYRIESGRITPAINSVVESSHNRECCICFEPHELSSTFYRLECCGHVYCKDCIKAQLDHLSIIFPVSCAEENCEQQFVWKDFEALVKGNIIRLQDIKSSSLKHFVSNNSAKYHHCITPDCDMVYVITERGEKFVCSQCGANVCTLCHCKWHDGYDSCVAYQKRNEKDTVVDDWMRRDQNNRKNCPSCGVPIEKNEGCRKVTCIKCKAKICWMCLEYYNSAKECYDHLVKQHGGIFDNLFD